jgi:hypothetical protein
MSALKSRRASISGEPIFPVWARLELSAPILPGAPGIPMGAHRKGSALVGIEPAISHHKLGALASRAAQSGIPPPMRRLDSMLGAPILPGRISSRTIRFFDSRVGVGRAPPPRAPGGAAARLRVSAASCPLYHVPCRIP